MAIGNNERQLENGGFFCRKKALFLLERVFFFKNISNIMKFYYFIDFVFGSLDCMKLHIF